MSNKKRYGVVYARYSTHNQRDVSIEQQVEACQAYADRENIEIVEVFADRAKTGRDDDRYNFQRMMRYAEQGTFQCVIAWKSNRMGRNMLEAMQNENTLEAFGVRCLYTEENFDDSAAGRFAKRTMMNINQFYSENLAEDVMRGMRDNAKKCLANQRQPYGFSIDKDHHIVINEDQAIIVRELFNRVANGEIFADIEKDFNKRGLKTSRGNPWNKSSIKRICQNEKYRGVYTYDDIRVEDGVPRIVSDEIFYRVQDAIGERANKFGRHTPNTPYLLTGKLFCGECKSPMVGTSGYGKGRNLYQYYKCKGCKRKPITKDYIEDFVADILVSKVLTDDTIKWIAMRAEEWQRSHQEGAESSILEEQIKDATNSIDNILKAIEQGIFTPSTKQRLLDLEKQKAELEDKLKVSKSKEVTITKEDIILVLNQFKDGDIKDERFRKDLFNIFITAVYVYGDRLTLSFTFDKSNTLDVDFKRTLDRLADEVSTCSDKDSLGLPSKSQTNTLFYGGIFFIVKDLP